LSRPEDGPTPDPKGIEPTLVLDLPAKEGASPRMLTLREPTGDQWRGILALPVEEREIAAVSLIGGIPASEIEGLGVSLTQRGWAWLKRWSDLRDLPPDPLDAPLTIHLAKPVQAGETVHAALNLREPTSGEWRDIRREDPVNRQIEAVARISGLSAPLTGRIGVRALARAERYLAGFISAAP
jgi:hypothetical protein